MQIELFEQVQNSHKITKFGIFRQRSEFHALVHPRNNYRIVVVFHVHCSSRAPRIKSIRPSLQLIFANLQGEFPRENLFLEKIDTGKFKTFQKFPNSILEGPQGHSGGLRQIKITERQDENEEELAKNQRAGEAKNWKI